MAKDSRMDEIREEFLKICPQTVWKIRDMISDPGTPPAVAAQLIGMVLDRALGKAEMPVKVTTTQENVERAEMQILAMIAEIENGMDENGRLLMENDQRGALRLSGNGGVDGTDRGEADEDDGFDDAGDEASGDSGESRGV